MGVTYYLTLIRIGTSGGLGLGELSQVDTPTIIDFDKNYRVFD
jgi:hypothetical protein